MFGRKRNSADNDGIAPGSAGEQAPVQDDAPAGNPAEAKKKGPTPKRSEQEAARKRPLVEDSREANRRAREEMRDQRNRHRAGVMAGDERYLGVRDRGPQRRFVRDFVDARTSVSEFFIPAAIVVLVIGMFGGIRLQEIANIVVYGLMAIVVLDCVVLNYRIKNLLALKHGGRDALEKGLTFYMVMRNIQLRALRIPKPLVRRGEFPS